MKQYYISSTKYSTKERQTEKYGKVYDIVFRVTTLDGVERQIRKRGFSSKTLAKQWHLQFIQENCELVTHKPIKKIDTTKELTFGDLYASYITTLNNQNKESTIFDKMVVFNTYVLSKYKDYKISKLTKEELYKWQDEMWTTKKPNSNEYYSFAYLKKIRSYFSSFLAWVEKRYNYPNNFKYVDMPKKRTAKTEMLFWDKEEFDRFISAVNNPMWKMFFMMLFYTGRRKGEVLALSPEDVQPDRISFNKSITRKTLDNSTYKVTSNKTEKRQFTLICKPLKDALKDYKGDAPFFFGGEHPLAENTVTRAFDRYISIAGVKRIRLHDLRHSFVSRCISLGASLPVVASLINDTLEQVVKTYAHLCENDLKRVVDLL